MKPRVLVVDDSAFARTTLAKILRAGGIDVVATARDGYDALEQIEQLDPDVVTLDLMMPALDGIGVLHALAGRPRPRVIVVSVSGGDTELGAEALALGAIDLVAKPTAMASDRLNEIGGELVEKVRAAGAPAVLPSAEGVPAPRAAPAERAELVMIGTSTGGPQALTRIVAALPANLAAPVAIVLHIPVGYTEALAARLDKLAAAHVVEASDGLALTPGLVVLARAGSHLRIARHQAGLRAEVSPLPIRRFTPSVDELFTSGALAVGKRALGIVLTGMGDDGLVGAQAIAAAGGALITEAASTCVVYGMPRVVYEARIGATSLALHSIADEIVRRA
jgi:two-component system, chemotaxis family, protein-glutamate methylesterase/glutaminase